MLTLHLNRYLRTLQFAVTVLRQECLFCLEKSLPRIRQSQVRRVTDSFLDLLEDLLANRPRPRRTLASTKNHLSFLCEACELGICPTLRQRPAQKQDQVQPPKEQGEKQPALEVQAGSVAS